MNPFQPREGQRQILVYQGGMMGVSAVPGSGKTATIVALTARLIAEGRTEGGILPTGQGVGAIDELPSVAELVERILAEASAALDRLCGSGD